MWLHKRGGVLLEAAVKNRMLTYSARMGKPLELIQQPLKYTPRAFDFFVRAEDSWARGLFHDFKEIN